MFLYINRSYIQYTGQSFVDVQCGGWERSLHPEDRNQYEHSWQDAVFSERAMATECRFVGRDERYRWFLVHEVPHRRTDDSIVHWIGTATEISAQKQREADQEWRLTVAQFRAEEDPLTGVLNRAGFRARMKRLMSETNRQPVAVFLLDLDNFKFFNDAYGHLAGDEVLIAVARMLTASCRDGDIVARLGGDEFAVLLPGVSRVGAEQWLAEIKQLLSGTGCHSTFNTYFDKDRAVPFRIPLRVSGGIAIVPDDDTAVEKVLAIADNRLYLDKLTARALWSKTMMQEFAAKFPGFDLLDRLITAVDSKDRYTQRHAEDVLILATMIGQHLGLDARTLDELRISALIHDVGKIGIPERLLRLPDKLTAEEYSQVQHHASLGAALIASSSPVLAQLHPGVIGAVRHHHERWDGQGYPDRLSGERISLPARILAVADAFSAITSDRPYRNAFSLPEAAIRLQNGAASQWDPVCVNALLQELGEKGRCTTVFAPPDSN